MQTCPVCGSTESSVREDHPEYRIIACGRCDVHFADPMRSPGREWYENHPLYKTRYQAVGHYVGWMHREFLRSVPAAGQRLVDVGCGTGDFVVTAHRSGFDAIGLDFDGNAVDIGRKYFNTDRLHRLSIEEYLEKAGRKSFDIITFFEVLEHLEDPAAFLENVRKALSDDGMIVFSLPNRDSRLTDLYRRIVPSIDTPPHHLTRWGKKAVHEGLGAHRFAVERIVTSTPTISDQVPDVYRTLLPGGAELPRKYVSIAASILLSPIDRWIVPRVVPEGRGMVVFARKRSS